jgi:hypothetical protein
LKTCLQCSGVREPKDFELGKSNRGILSSGLDVRELGDSGVKERDGSDMVPLGDFGFGESGLGKSDLGESGMRELGGSGMRHLGGSDMGPL